MWSVSSGACWTIWSPRAGPPEGSGGRGGEVAPASAGPHRVPDVHQVHLGHARQPAYYQMCTRCTLARPGAAPPAPRLPDVHQVHLGHSSRRPPPRIVATCAPGAHVTEVRPGMRRARASRRRIGPQPAPRGVQGACHAHLSCIDRSDATSRPPHPPRSLTAWRPSTTSFGPCSRPRAGSTHPDPVRRQPQTRIGRWPGSG